MSGWHFPACEVDFAVWTDGHASARVTYTAFLRGGGP